MASATGFPTHHHVRFFLILFLLLRIRTRTRTAAAAQTVTEITRGTTLTPSGRLSYVASPSGDFGFGFYPLSNDSGFLLAVWFAGTAPKTVVWSANGDSPVGPAAQLVLTTDGQFALTNGAIGRPTWQPAGVAVSSVSLLDTGNLVVFAADYAVLWQSFAFPTDTMVPAQVLNQSTFLQSRLADSGYSKGRFQLLNRQDGDLVFLAVNAATGYEYAVYEHTATAGNDTQLVFDPAGLLYFDVKNGSTISFPPQVELPTDDFYQRMTLDSDGALRQYVYPKPNASSSSWPSRWTAVQSIPPDICKTVTPTGSGVCGFNSFCVIDASLRPVCKCPPQHSFVDPKNQYSGCTPDFPPQSCRRDESALFDLVELITSDFPYGDYELYSPIDEDRCKAYCLRDCFCYVAIFRDGSCWKKKMPVSNGREGTDVGGKTLIKVPKDNSTRRRPNQNHTEVIEERRDRRTAVIVGSLILGVSALLNTVLVAGIAVALCHFCCRRKQKLVPDSALSGLHLRAFSYTELEEATDNFREELGSGSFGAVYKGVLALESETRVAVKTLHERLREPEKEFTNEVTSIGRTYHKNLVRLFGFCNEGTHRLLVYEYMSNGPLTDYLFGTERPSWTRRVQIALGVAKGLLYLHEECEAQIIHCDIKPQNILLDDNLTARISDFGLAKLLMNGQTRTDTDIRGTRGYVAPEWFRNRAVTAKVDVYSFGVVLLEIICCRRTVERERDEDEAVLAYWAYDCFTEDMLSLLVENDDEATADMSRVERFATVAIWCIQEDPSLRPSMRKIVQMLEGAVEVPTPPDPSPSQSATTI